MNKKLQALAAACVLAAGTAHADTLARIQKTGAVVMGVRASSGALSFAFGNGRYGGFHVELCEWVLDGVKTRLGMPKLAVRYREVTPQDTTELLKSGAIDLECGATVNTSARQREVGFALTTYVHEGRLREPIAIVMRKGDPAFKKAVDDTLATMMRSGDMADLYVKWFVQIAPPKTPEHELRPNDATLHAWSYPNDRPAEVYPQP